jgi:hypothetical protein
MRVIAIALLASAAGCLTTDAPTGFVARRHACSALEGQTLVSASGRVVVAAGDEDFSTYEWTRTDGSVTNGLAQCEAVEATTLIYADAAELATGRFDANQLVWFGEAVARSN